MPKQLRARSPADDMEEQQVRRLAGARSATFDTVLRSRIVALSWDGLDTAAIAAEVRCHPKTVREWISRFNQEGVSSLTERPKVGRKPRLTDDDRRTLVTLAHRPPEHDERTAHMPSARVEPSTREQPCTPHWLHAERRWTLNGLVHAARARGVHISRSQLRRVLLETGFYWDRDGYWIPPVPPGPGRTAAS